MGFGMNPGKADLSPDLSEAVHSDKDTSSLAVLYFI